MAKFYADVWLLVGQLRRVLEPSKFIDTIAFTMNETIFIILLKMKDYEKLKF